MNGEVGAAGNAAAILVFHQHLASDQEVFLQVLEGVVGGLHPVGVTDIYCDLPSMSGNVAGSSASPSASFNPEVVGVDDVSTRHQAIRRDNRASRGASAHLERDVTTEQKVGKTLLSHAAEAGFFGLGNDFVKADFFQGLVFKVLTGECTNRRTGKRAAVRGVHGD